ncbi:MAG: hypothetical protein EXR79_12670 [Myxococcales bacterium]|nr:hypothetical protein [Myxococcales bacterium]
MSLTQEQSLASLRLLVAVAQADETLHEAERGALLAALEALPTPEGASLDPSTLQDLFSTPQDVPALLAQLRDAEAKEDIYQSMYAMAWADGDCSPVEQGLLNLAREELGIAEERQGVLERLYSEAKDTVLPSHIVPEPDPVRRAEDIERATLKYSVMSAVLGAFPVPGLAILTDVGVVGIQVKLVRDVGQYHGHTVDAAAAKSILGALGVGTGARMAVNNLAKLVPGWGSLVGASTSFATTWALGKVSDNWFLTGALSDPAELKGEFAQAKSAGTTMYEQQKDTIEATRRDNSARIQALTERARAGEISQTDYQARVNELM